MPPPARPVTVLIAAAGRGRRAQADGGGVSLKPAATPLTPALPLMPATTAPPLPKQYEPLAGLPVLGHTLTCFLTHSGVDSIAVVIHEDDTALYEACLDGLRARRSLDPARLLPPVIGGKTRADSVRNGLRALESITNADHTADRTADDDANHAAGHAADHAIVLVHDAARPLVPHDVINRVIAATDAGCGAIAALPVSDTLKQGTPDAFISATHPRAGMWQAQTPQGFMLHDLCRAYRAAGARTTPEAPTDEAAVAEASGLAVKLVMGARQNMKITLREDFRAAERYLAPPGKEDDTFSNRAIRNNRPIWQHRIGQGVDVHGFEPGKAVILGGISIAHDRKLKGHSDADVVLHALTDALLGALGAGDIGDHFPPSDPAWRGAPSEVFLNHAVKLLEARGGQIVNCDTTIICEAPKIGPYRQRMRENIARILTIPESCVSIKATTTEGLGFTGRKEGICAMATASIALPGEEERPDDG